MKWKIFGWRVVFTAIIPLILLFPRIFLFKDFAFSSPFWASNAWELIDPIVSGWVMVPGHRAFMHVVFEQGSLFWSSLRGLGLPLLGNELQAAPLFPLTWLLLKFPEPYFYNLLALFRLFLAGLGAVLIAVRIFEWKLLSSLAFTLSFAYATANLQYLNHPFLNGVAAGVWAIYFMMSIFKGYKDLIPSISLKNGMGFALSVYSLITCGFPESALMMGIISVLVLIPAWAQIVGSFKRSSKVHLRFIFEFLFWGILPFALASVQIFSVLEFLSLTPKNYREALGLLQFQNADFLWSMVARLQSTPVSGLMRHHFGILILSLAFFGFLSWLIEKKPSKMGWGAVLCLVFYFAKIVPVSSTFNQLVAFFPVADVTRFTSYGFLILLWGVAYFAGRGVQSIFYTKRSKEESLLILWVVLLVSTFILVLAIGKAPDPSRRHIIQVAVHLLLFGTISFLSITLDETGLCAKVRKVLAALFGVMLVLEAIQQNSRGFLRLDSSDAERDFQFKTPSLFLPLLTKANLQVIDLRERSGGGSLTSIGIATVDNGAPPILTDRLTRLRKALFERATPGEDSAAPFTFAKTPYSWQLIGTNLYREKQPFLPLSSDTREFEKIGQIGNEEVLIDRSSLGRAYLAKSCQPVVDFLEAERVLKSEGAMTLGHILLETKSALDLQFCREWKGALTRLSLSSDFGSTVTLPEIEGPNLVVLNDNFYPGWHAKDLLTQVEYPVLAANLGFRAIIIPQSARVQLQFNYQPPWWPLARVLTLIGIVGLLIGILLGIKNGKVRQGLN